MTTERFEFEPALTCEQVFEGEEAEKARGARRRIALMVLTLSSDDLREGIEKDREMLEHWLQLVEAIPDYLAARKAEIDMMESVQARLLAILKEYADEEVGND